MKNQTSYGLVLSGASSKLPCHVGALKSVFEEYRFPPRELWGTSAGALVATCLACGYTPQDIEEVIYKTDFSYFLRTTIYEKISSVLRFLPKREDYLIQFLEDLYGGKTFKELEANLNILVHSMKMKSYLILNKEFSPDMKISFAVRASISIPVLFSPVPFTWKDGSKDYFIDGGVSKNFSVDLAALKGYYIGHQVISESREGVENFGVKDISLSVLDYMMSENVRNSLAIAKQTHPEGVIAETYYEKALWDFSLSKEEKKKMIHAGYSSMNWALSKG